MAAVGARLVGFIKLTVNGKCALTVLVHPSFLTYIHVVSFNIYPIKIYNYKNLCEIGIFFILYTHALRELAVKMITPCF